MQWLVFVDGALWVLLVGMDAVVLQPGSLSEFETKRRAISGDGEAQKDHHRRMVLPKLQALQWLVVTLLLVVVSALTIMLWGWGMGMAIAIILAVSRRIITKSRWLHQTIQRQYKRHESVLMNTVQHWQWLLRFAPLSVPVSSVVGSKQELRAIIAGSDFLSPEEQKHIEAAWSFADKKVGDVMTPAARIDSIDSNETIGPLALDALHKTGHAIFPVTAGDLNHIVGLLYLRDLVELKSAKLFVKEAMDPRVTFIDQSKDLRHALHMFMTVQSHLFVVINKHHETVGLLSLQDVIEALGGRQAHEV